MAQENVRIIDIEVKGVSTVKELKEEIKDLRDRLVRLDETSEDYQKTVEELIVDEKKLVSVMKAGKEEVSAATGSYNALVNEMSALKKVWRQVTSESERARIGERIGQINAQLKEMDASIGNFQRSVGDYENAFKKALLTPQQELRNLRKELANLTVGTEEYNRTFLRMAELSTQVRKQQELLKYSSADLGDILTNLAGVTSSVVGGFSAMNAAMSLMGNEDEDIQQAMLKAQRMIQLVQGLSALENLGPKIQGLFNGIKNFVKSFNGGAVAVSDFNKALKETEGATVKTTTELNTQAQTLSSNAVATEQQAEATAKLDIEAKSLTQTIQELNREFRAESDAILQSNANSDEKAKSMDRLRAKYMEQAAAVKAASAEEKQFTINTQKAVKAAYEQPKVTIATNNAFKLLRQSLGKTKNEVVQYTAASNGAAVATKIMTGAVTALGVAMKAIGIGLIIGALTALLGLLGKALKPLWDWVTGTTAAKNATDALKKSTDELNKTLEENSESLDFQSRLMEAQGKDYEEIYNYKKQQITADLNLAKAHLRESEAQAAAIGTKKLAKAKYKEFNETLEEQRNIVQELTKDLKKLDQEKTIHDAQEETNRRKSVSGGGGGSYNQELKAAQNLYKQLADYYKTDRQKLAETYEANKKTIEKYIKNKEQKNKALLLLEKKYYDDLKKLTRENMDAIYGIYMGQENRRLALMDVWGDKYLERAMNVLNEEEKIAIAGAKKKVGFEEKTDAEIAKMDKRSQAEYKKRQTLFNNEKYLIEREYSQKRLKLQEEDNQRQIDEQRRLIEVKKYQVTSDEDLLKVEMELAEFDLKMIEQNRKLGESDAEYALRLNEAAAAVENLKKKEQELKASRDTSQLKLDNDATESGIVNGKDSMQYYDAQIKAAQYYYDNLKQLQNESNEEFRQRQLEALDRLKELEAQKLQQRLDNWSRLANGIGNIMGSIADYYQTEIDAQKDADGKYNAESKKKFEWVKNLQIAQATIQTISGAIAAFMGCQSLGQPWGLILGAVEAAAVTAAGIAQIAQIKKTKLDGNSNTAGGGTTYATAVPMMTDYLPQGTTNLTGGQETEDLANALSKTNIVVSVVDINDAQDKVKTRVVETTF